MWELLPESWHQELAESSCYPPLPFVVWTCHELPSMDRVLCHSCCCLGYLVPPKMPHFMAYLQTITRTSRNFEGMVWVSYNMAYRHQAANQRSLDWEVFDSALYNEACTDRAQLISKQYVPSGNCSGGA